MWFHALMGSITSNSEFFSVFLGLFRSGWSPVGASASVLIRPNYIQRSTCQSAAKTISTLILFRNYFTVGCKASHQPVTVQFWLWQANSQTFRGPVMSSEIKMVCKTVFDTYLLSWSVDRSLCPALTKAVCSKVDEAIVCRTFQKRAKFGLKQLKEIHHGCLKYCR